MARGPLDVVFQMAAIFDDLGVPYALGGSMASSLLGEPRSTVDVDMAVRLDVERGEELLDRVESIFYVPPDAAREAIRLRSSFNLVDTTSSLKVDLFVLGVGLLDRMQIERRRLVSVVGADREIWVTSTEDQVLRKLDWFRRGGSVSDRQWRDVLGILRTARDRLDATYLRATAAELDLTGLLDDALGQVHGTWCPGPGEPGASR